MAAAAREGRKRHEVPCHPELEGYFTAWTKAAGIGQEKKEPLFRSIGKGERLSQKAMSKFDVFHMIKRRAKAAGLPYSTCCHTFRATGITAYLENGGTLEHAQTIANHESPRTTKLYDRRASSYRPRKSAGLESKAMREAPAKKSMVQLALLCACGDWRIRLPALGQCRLCYHRNYHSEALLMAACAGAC